jgi:DNA-binding transcriptional LysR family regulator
MMRNYDLNLLRVLDAVLDAGSVTAAAERLHLSVPATSHALARLRQVAGDPLLVRAGRRLVPTPRAQALRQPVAQWVAQASTLLTTEAAEPLATLPRRFIVRAPDGVPIALGAPLALAMGRDMPCAEIQFIGEHDGGTLREDEVDLDIGWFRPRDPELHLIELLHWAPVAMVQRSHPLAGQRLTARRYAAHPHVDVQTRTPGLSTVDRALAAQGLKRKVVMTVAHANIAPLIASRSGLVATVSERMGQAMAPALDMVVLPLAFSIDREALVMAWHPRQHDDRAHRWLRTELLSIARASGRMPG